MAPDVRKSFEKLLNALENGGNGSHMAEVRELYANVKQFQVDRNSGKAGDSVHVALVSSSLLKMRTSLDKNRLELEARAAQEQDADKAEEQVNEARSEEAEVDAADHAEDDLDDWFEAADDAVNAAENNADDQVHSDSIDPQNSEASVRQNQDNALSAGADGNSVSGQENQGYNFSSDIYVNTDSAQESQGYNFSSDIYVNTDSGSQDQNAPQSGQADSNASDYMQDQLYMMPNAAPYGEIQGDELDQFVAGLPQDNSAEQLSGREKENSGKLRISLEELQNGSEHKRQSKVMKNGKAEKGKEIHQHNSEKGFSPFSK